MIAVDGVASDDIKDLARRVDIKLLSVDGIPAVNLMKSAAYIKAQTIPGDAYRGVASTPSLAIPTLWAVSAKLNDQLVYDLTKSIWHDAQQNAAANPGDALRLHLAPQGVSLPLHPGAQKFYDENKDLLTSPSTN
jgi:TRAP transporter TAXI family solute receptor